MEPEIRRNHPGYRDHVVFTEQRTLGSVSQSNIDPGESTHYGLLDVRKLPPGSYRIKVHAFAPDAIDDEEITDTITVGSTRIYIKLQ